MTITLETLQAVKTLVVKRDSKRPGFGAKRS